MSDYFTGHRNRLFRGKAEFLYKQALERYATHPIKTRAGFLKELITALEEYYARLRHPILDKGHKVTPGSIPSLDAWDDLREVLQADLGSLYSSETGVADRIPNMVNSEQGRRRDINSTLFKSLLGISKIRAEGLKGSNRGIIFGETFQTPLAVDALFPVSNTRAVINTNGNGSLELGRKSVAGGSEILEAADVRFVVGAAADDQPLNTPTEGAAIVGVDLNGVGLGKGYGVYPLGFLADTSEDGIRFDISRLHEDLKPIRLATDDDATNPLSMFEFEMVLLDASPAPLVYDEFARYKDVVISSTRNDTPSTYLPQRPAERFEGLSDRFLRYVWNQAPVQNASDGFQLAVGVYITLETPQKLSSFSLDLHTFGNGVTPTGEAEILVVKDDGDEEWFHLQEGEVGFQDGVLGTDQKTFTWTIPSLTVKTIKIVLSQDRGYPMAYTMDVAEMTFLRHHYIVGGGFSHTTTVANYYTLIDSQGRRLQEKLAADLRSIINIRTLDDGTESQNVLAAEAAVQAELPALIDENTLEVSRELWSGAVAHWKALRPQVDGTETDEAFSDPRHPTLGDEGTITIPSNISNRYRYAIGILDIDVNLAVYDTVSEAISESLSSPIPVSSLFLDVIEDVPEEYPDDTNWIEYYVSVDAGATFHRIAPIQAGPALDSSGRLIPNYIQVNSPLTADERRVYPWGDAGFIDLDTDVYDTRVKIVLRRPSTSADFELTTPRVISYRLVANGNRPLGEV